MRKPDSDKAHHRPRLVSCSIVSLAAFHTLHPNISSCFLTHFDVEEPRFEGIHLAGSSAEVVHYQVEGPGGQEVGVRATKFLPACREEKLQLHRVQRFSLEIFIWSFFDCAT